MLYLYNYNVKHVLTYHTVCRIVCLYVITLHYIIYWLLYFHILLVGLLLYFTLLLFYYNTLLLIITSNVKRRYTEQLWKCLRCWLPLTNKINKKSILFCIIYSYKVSMQQNKFSFIHLISKCYVFLLHVCKWIIACNLTNAGVPVISM